MKGIADFVRWRDWGPSKLPVLCTVVYYIGLSSRQLSAAFVVNFGLFILFAALHSALGYVANDWGDRELDARHGKPNVFASLTRSQGMAALAALATMALLSGLPFVRRSAVPPLWAGWAFFALGYSLRPLRLKERGALGLAFSFVAQWSLPIMLAFAVLNRFGGWDMIAFVVATTVSGATLEIAHQRWDRERDLTTQTGTLGTRSSASKLNRLFAAALLLDKIALGVMLVTVTVGLAPLTIGTVSLSPGAPLVAVYSVLLAASMFETHLLAKQSEILDPYYSTRHSFSKLLHETMPNLLVPAYLVAVAAAYESVNGIVLLAFLYWRLVLGHADWRWPLQSLKGLRRKGKRSGTEL